MGCDRSSDIPQSFDDGMIAELDDLTRQWFATFAVTAIVHAREPRVTARQIGLPGTVALLAQLPVSLLCTAAHPLGIGLVLGGDLSGPLAALLLLGYAAAVAVHAAAAPGARWVALLLPFYWLLHWAALLLALSDLVRDPAHWRKTDHGCTARPVVSQEQVEVGAALSAQ